ncbi:dienelactone hydrolase family protein [Streptomyces armeniacus]|uniref:Dienelactone hydrolase family protein n=1 Tax=Streptomyces armeniacus TaxID=83291 RepID=A0A345XWL6_9ACTN|nr:dienelactone hydrolase family protein [Streptomyces armeniacus]AXK36032.1 dienelactone hydrolase family protein [Streptomyces armeniacus]
MCHPVNGRPPAAPIVTGGVAEHGPLELSTADGNRFRAYHAVPEAPIGRSLVILPDRRGLHPFYEALAQRCAEAGFRTVVIDFYGRTAGTAPRDESFDWAAHMPLLEAAHVDADIAAATAWLRERSTDPVFTVGFCLGGSHSWRQAAGDLGLAGAIGFYGPPRFFGDSTADLSAPLLLLLAGDDAATSQAEFQALVAGFDKAGKEYEMHVYEGAPHSFFDVSFGDWTTACTDAWQRILDFTARHGSAV